MFLLILPFEMLIDTSSGTDQTGQLFIRLSDNYVY